MQAPIILVLVAVGIIIMVLAAGRRRTRLWQERNRALGNVQEFMGKAAFGVQPRSYLQWPTTFGSIHRKHTLTNG